MNLTKPLTIAAMSAILFAATTTESQAQELRVKAGPVKARVNLGSRRRTVTVKTSPRHRRREVIEVGHRHRHGACCEQKVLPGHYEIQRQRVYQPGRYVYETRTIQVPGRWQVTYKNVTIPGYYKTVARRVTTPGRWVVERRARRSHTTIDFGRHVRVDFSGPRRHRRRWIPPCTRIVQEKVWVPARTERRAIRVWIKPCCRTQKVKVYRKPCWTTRNVRVYVPGKTVWVCDAPRPRRVIRHHRRHRRHRHRDGVIRVDVR